MSVNRPTNIDSVLGVTHRSYSSGVIGSRRRIRFRCWRIQSVIWIQLLTLSTLTGNVSRASTIEADYPVSRCSDCFLHWVCDRFASCRRAVRFAKFVQLPMYSRLHFILPLTLVHEKLIELRLYLPRPITFLCCSNPIHRSSAIVRVRSRLIGGWSQCCSISFIDCLRLSLPHFKRELPVSDRFQESIFC